MSVPSSVADSSLQVWLIAFSVGWILLLTFATGLGPVSKYKRLKVKTTLNGGPPWLQCRKICICTKKSGLFIKYLTRRAIGHFNFRFLMLFLKFQDIVNVWVIPTNFRRFYSGHYLMCRAKHTMGVYKSHWIDKFTHSRLLCICFVRNSCLFRFYTSLLIPNWSFCVISQYQA